MAPQLLKNPIDPHELRRKLGLSQTKFWEKLGVTQSGGSRYEKDRCLPKAVAMLLDIVYLKEIDPKNLDDRDGRILSFLKDGHPDLYKALYKQVGNNKLR